jgi:hypothetical protein
MSLAEFDAYQPPRKDEEPLAWEAKASRPAHAGSPNRQMHLKSRGQRRTGSIVLGNPQHLPGLTPPKHMHTSTHHMKSPVNGQPVPAQSWNVHVNNLGNDYLSGALQRRQMEAVVTQRRREVKQKQRLEAQERSRVWVQDLKSSEQQFLNQQEVKSLY